MDANGTRFHLLLGAGDWGRCRVESAGATSELRDGWDAVPRRDVPFDWDTAHSELTLRKRVAKFVAAPADSPVFPEDRRGAAADRYGNVYWIDETRTRVLVRSTGSLNVAPFWPDARGDPPDDHGDFSDAFEKTPVAQHFAGVAVTEDHYLAVGTVEPPGLLVFDLVAGGSPFAVAWPGLVPLDFAARPGCGLWVLSADARYWALDQRFGVVAASATATIADIDAFQPVTGTALRRRETAALPAGVVLSASAVEPIAIEALPGGEVLILDAGSGTQTSRVLCFRDERRLGSSINAGQLDFRAHDFVFLPPHESEPGRLLVVSKEGNQAFAFIVVVTENDFRLDPLTDFYPMRRFRGKGPVRSRDESGKPQALYDFGETWVPLVAQRRARYIESAELLTRPFDSAELDCVWHRLMVDACIPLDARVTVWSRAANEVSELGSWDTEPALYLRASGPELPWIGTWPGRAAASRKGDGEGTWELLFQRAHGRYLQIKLLVEGDGRTTPRLRALRTWYPRYSYLARHLPAVYREDTESASFFERFLANFEGTFTALEDCIASTQALLDVRSAPADALAWLAGWFGVAMDPAWDERRQRLFIRHAMDFFQYRGTVHGLKMALHLAFNPDISDADLGPPGTVCPHTGDVRIVENYLLRRGPSVLFGEPEELAGPRIVTEAGKWSPTEGSAGLVRRYRQTAKGKATNDQNLPPPLAGFDDSEQEKKWPGWQSFLQQTLGSLPTGGVQERERWQQYLASEYESVAALNVKHGTGYVNYTGISLPDDEPRNTNALEDWRAFVSATADGPQTLDRARWQDFLAQRYRRIEALNAVYFTRWSSFAWIPLPDRLPGDGAALDDWVQFELRAQPMYALAHTFRVLLPTPAGGNDPAYAKAQMDLAQRIVDLEKPAHTTFDVRFFWALFRIGDARLGTDTLLDQGSRAFELLPDTVVGRSFVGTSFVAPSGPKDVSGRMTLAC